MFKNAKFGTRYIARNGDIAIYGSYVENHKHHLLFFNNAYAWYNDDGTYYDERAVNHIGNYEQKVKQFDLIKRDDNHSWIDVNEKVPEFYLTEKHNEQWHNETKQTFFSDCVLVYAKHAQLDDWEIDYACYEKRYNYHTKQWEEPTFRGISNPIYNVKYWMPLPEPPIIN